MDPLTKKLIEGGTSPEDWSPSPEKLNDFKQRVAGMRNNPRQKAWEPSGYPTVKRGQVVDLDGEPLPSGYSGWMEAHPEGTDRGGYVPYITDGTTGWYFEEADGEWSTWGSIHL